MPCKVRKTLHFATKCVKKIDKLLKETNSFHSRKLCISLNLFIDFI